MRSSVYKIIIKDTLDFYVGSTKAPKKRFNEHLNDLRTNKHHCYPLQQLFNLYGESSLEIEPISQFKTLEEAREVEDLVLKSFDTLNLSMSAYYPQTVLYEGRRKDFSDRMEGNTHNIGRKASQNTKEKMSKTRTGKSLSKEARTKVSESKKREVFKKNREGDILQKFKSVKEAAVAVGGLPQNISKCLTKQQKTAYGFVWEYVDKSSFDRRIIDTKTGRVFKNLKECAEYFQENPNNIRAYMNKERKNNKYNFLKTIEDGLRKIK